jgi:hypothetical protein
MSEETVEDDNKIEVPESDYLYTATSQIPNAGKGLITAIPIYKGEIIALFKGEILTNFQAKSRAEKGEDNYFINMLDGSIMDSADVECFAKYANDANGLVQSPYKNNSKIALDEMENVCLIATRGIKTGEEIFCSYGKRYWQRVSVSEE